MNWLKKMFGLNNICGKAAGLRRIILFLDVSADDSMTSLVHGTDLCEELRMFLDFKCYILQYKLHRL